jgi:hypothetical protein
MATGGRVGLANGNLVDPRMQRSLAENVQKLSTQPRAQNADLRDFFTNQATSQAARSMARTAGGYPNFLQMSPENISQARKLTYPQAFALEKQYKYNPNYAGADKTSRLGYFKQGLQSLAGIQQPGSNVGGATPLTRKLALDVGEKVLPALGKGLAAVTSLPAQATLMTLNPTTANADEANMTIEDFQNLYNSPEEQAAREADKARQAATPTPDAGRTLTTANNLLGQSYTPGALSDYGIYYYGGDDYEIFGDTNLNPKKVSKDEVEKYMLEKGMTPSPNYQKPTMADVAGPSPDVMSYDDFHKAMSEYYGRTLGDETMGYQRYTADKNKLCDDYSDADRLGIKKALGETTRPTMADVAGPKEGYISLNEYEDLQRNLMYDFMKSPGNRNRPKEEIEQNIKNIVSAASKDPDNYLRNYMGNFDSIIANRLASGGRVGLMGGTMPMGEPRVNQGGITELDYRAKGGFVPVGIKEKADDVPAMLSKNEFVFTADAVRGAGNGSVEKGAQKMYDTMKNLERRVT